MDKDTLERNIRTIIGDAYDFSVQIDDHHAVIVVIEVDPSKGSSLEEMRQMVEREVSEFQGVSKASVILTAQKEVQAPAKKRHVDPHGMDKNPPVDVPAKNILVVASGKGGVGKSTVSANLAAGLAARGLKVGLLDADIYGPSQPVMMGDADYKPSLNDERKLIPLERHGLKIMSIGFIADTDKALVWRGPMVQTAFYQMLRDVAWGRADEPLDYLIIDLPPGTGDVQLTLAQKVKATGAIIVSTPQDIALIDARRAVEMFNKTNVPVLGLVENMSTHVCSNCGHKDAVFGEGGAKTLGLDLLGALPLSRDVREMSDAGTPIVIAEPESDAAKSFQEIIDVLML